jgi:type I restriction enzyme S subunit
MRDGWVATSLSEVVEHSIGGVWGGESGTDEVEVTVVRSTEFTKRGFLNFETGVPRSIKSSQLKSRELKPGDILLEKSGGGPDQPVGRVVFVTEAIPEKFVCSNFVQLIRPNSEQIEPLLLFHIMWQWHAINRTLEFQAQTTGIRNLRTPDYLQQEINLPPLPEQKRIVDLISSVDSYIESLQQQLDSAKRSRNAVLHELLTAGGEDWVETNLGLVSEFIMGQAPLGERCNKDGIGTPFVKAGEFDENRPKIVEWTTDPLKMAKSSDVLVCVVGATAGKINLGADCAIGRSVAAVRPGQELNQFFLYYLLSLELSNLRSGSRGSAQGVITKDDLHRIAVNLPPLTEQERIIEIISSMDKVADQTQLAITEAQNLRSGLLSDLLSGEHEIPASYDKVIGAA